MSDFLVGKFKSLEAAQSLKVGSKTITNIIDSSQLGIDSAVANSLIDSAFTAKSTNNLSEGNNLYYTKTRSDSDFNVNFNLNNSLLTADRLNEGETNLFYTDDRVRVVSLDSEETIQLIDSAYVQARTSGGGLDSSSAIALIDSSHVQARQTSSAVTIYSTIQQLVSATGMAQGDQALVTATNNIYIYAGSGWFKIATVQNNSPTPITGVDSNYTLAVDGTATTITAASTDPEGFPITFGFSTSGLGSIATVSQDSSVFTITPSTNTSNFGTFTLTITATDNVNGAINFPASFTLTFAVDWSSHSLSQSLQSSATSENAFFGENLEIDGNYAVIGARGHGPSYTGKAFIFYKNSGTWAQQQELTISDGSTTNFYGQNVSISGNTAAVSATGGNGSCYIFTRSGTTWTQQTKLSAPTASSGFGQEISLVGDKLVVGMYGYDSGSNTNIGRLVSYTRSGTTWSSAATIDLSDGEAGDLLGYDSLRISEDGNYLIAGVTRRDNSSNTDEGVAYIFYWNGSAWSQQAKLEASDGAAGFNFGGAVAITDKYAAVGALFKTSETGAVYIFTRSGTTWTQRIILGAGGTIPSDLSTGDQFGFGIDIHKNSMVVAAANRASPKGNGHVYVFTTSDDGVTWTQRKKFTTTSGDIHDNYGQDSKGVGIDETSETIVVGAGYDDSGNTAAGKIYFYED